MHGGSTPGQVAKAAEEAARAAMVTYGRPVDTNGIDALLEELRWTYGHVLWLRDQVAAIEPAALVWGMSKRKAEGSMAMEVLAGGDVEMIPTVGVEATEAAGVSVWVKLYLEERKHLLEVAKTCVGIGLDERRIRLEEAKGAALVAGLQWLFAELRLTTRQLERANGLAVAMLRGLAAGQAPTIEAGPS